MNINCSNCGQMITENYCSNCGQAREFKRINKDYAIQEFLSLAGYENGFFFTCRQLLIRPGKVIREYINVNRQKITKPITFLVLTSVIFSLISHYFKTDIAYADAGRKLYGNSSLNDINLWIQQNYGYANLLMILPITLWTSVFFRKYNYNFYETFIVISFVMGFGMLLYSIEPLLNLLLPHRFIQINVTIGLVAIVYAGWAI